MHILVAEDDFISRKLISTVLRDLGHEVTAATDGLDAWEQYQNLPSRLVISDWLMPRMDGLELVRKIRASAHAQYTYIIMLTANVGQRQNYYEAMAAGADDFLSKPLDRFELEVRLRVAERILRAMTHIQSLENVLTICAYTKKINIPEEGWQTIEEFMDRHLGIKLSHGIEPGYYEQVIRPQIDELKKHTAAGAPAPASPPGPNPP